jgi:hypothetical protein
MRDERRSVGPLLVVVVVVGTVLFPVGAAGSVGLDAERDASTAATDERTETATTAGSGVTTRRTQSSSPTTADEFLAAFRSLEGNEALQQYSELEAIRSQAVVEVQSGTFSEREREQMAHVLAVLRSFSSAYALMTNETPQGSLENANETERALAALEAADGNRYAALARVALDRLYRSLATTFQEASQSAASTPERLALMDRAARAYRRAGATQRFSQLSVQRDRLRAEFAADRERLNESTTVAGEFVDGCGTGCRDPVVAARTAPLATFGRYAAARQAAGAARTARAIAAEHGLSSGRERAAAVAESATGAVRTFAIASAALVAGYVVAIAIVAGVVAGRVRAWAASVSTAEQKTVVAPAEVAT